MARQFADERGRSPRNEAEYHARRQIAGMIDVVGPPAPSPPAIAQGGSARSVEKGSPAVAAPPAVSVRPSSSAPSGVQPLAGVVRAGAVRSAPPAGRPSADAPVGAVNRFLRVAADKVSDLRTLIGSGSRNSGGRSAHLAVAPGSVSSERGIAGLPAGLAGVAVRSVSAGRSQAAPGAAESSSRASAGTGRPTSRPVAAVPTALHRPVVSRSSADRSVASLER